jgi:hypothetical protein
MLDLAKVDLDEIATALSDQENYEHELHEEYPEQVSVWNAFRDNRAQRRAVDFLADRSLIDSAAAERFRAEHPDPKLP